VVRSSIRAIPESRRRWLSLAVIVMAQFMVVLDIAIVNVALPSIKSDLHFPQASLQWVISAYAIVFGGFLLLGGRLADVLGRKRLFVTGLTLFSASSLLCGIAWSEGSLIAFRAIQGLGGAMLAPAALSILMTTFREGRERNLALGIWGAASGSGGAAGVLLGGLLTSALSWSWVFFINVPVGAVAVVASLWLLRESRSELRHRHFDIAGATSVTSGLMLLVYALTRTATSGWGNPTTLAFLGGSAALLAVFIAIELRSTAPLLPLRIFRLRTLAAANVIAVIVGSAMFSQFFLLTLYMQEVLHYSALQTGAGFVVTTLSIVIFANVGQMLVTRFGVRPVLASGLLLASVALGLLTQLPANGHYFADLFPAYLLSGIGMAFTFVPMTIAGLTGVSPADAGVASGLINTTRQIGGAVGLAAVSTIAATSAGHGVTASLAAADLTHGFRTAFDVLTVLMLVGVAITLRFIRPAPRLVVAVPASNDIQFIDSLEEAA
jgi:EmrB/QacA subfamily drug resistance transporter